MLFFCALLLTSCVSREKIVYYQNITDLGDTKNTYEARLKPDDLLMIIVSAPDGAADEFNLPAVSVVGTSMAGPLDASATQLRYQSYLIDKDGNIDFPVLGTIKLGGLTRTEALQQLRKELINYIKDPVINLRIINFEISVSGEVVRPGTFNIQTERITLPEALTLAGDMTIYGNRKKVLIIRENEGKISHNYVDMTNADFINSPFYYLTQNDMVYVEPNKTKINSSAVGPNISVAISAVSVLIALAALITR